MRLTPGRVAATVSVAAVWLATRGLVVRLLEVRHDWVAGDLDYFAGAISSLPGVGLAGTLVEYPVPAVLVVAVPWLVAVSLGSAQIYGDVVLVLSLLADATFTVALARFAHRRRPALTVWLLAVPLLGATTYARFDLVPGLLTGVALLLLARHPRVAGAAVALGASVKLWPALVLPALMAARSSRARVGVAAGLTGLTLATVSAVVAGASRSVSPLAWQAERGLQIESVAATPAMVSWVTGGGQTISFGEHNAYEVDGPWVPLLLGAAETLSALAPLLLAALWFRALRRPGELRVETVAWSALGAVGLLLVTSKVLSPQYLLWLLPLTAAAVGVTRGRGLRAWAALLLLTTGLTQLVFPELYVHLTADGEHAGGAVLALAVRNVGLVALTGWALVAAFRGVSGGARSPASRRDPTGTSTGPGDVGPTTPRRRRVPAPRQTGRPPPAAPR